MAASTGQNATAIGAEAAAASVEGVALGYRAQALGTNGNIAIGSGAQASGVSAAAIGVGASASDNGALAAGINATASTVRALALGAGASAAQAGAVALGAGAVTGAAVGTATGTIAGVTYAYAGSAPVATVSIGNTGSERTLTNLAAGRVNASSTDAINGSQLFATQTAVTTLDTQVDALGGTVATGLGGGSTYDPATGTLTGPTYSIGGTTFTSVDGALTNIDGRVTQNTTDITQLTGQINNGSVGLVQQDAASRTITVARATDGGIVDMTGTQGARIITGVANGAVSAASLEAINGSQLYGVSQSLSSALGGGSTVNPDGTVTGPVFNVGGTTFNSVGDAINHLASGGTQAKYFHANSLLADSAAAGIDSVSIGPAASASANNAVALGNGANAGHADSVALGSGSQTTVGAQAGYSGAYVGASTSTGEVAVGGRQVTGVAAGSAPSDAVNVSQLQSGVDSAVNQANQYTETRVTQLAGAAVSVINLQQGREGMFRVSVNSAAAPTVSGLNAAAGGAGSTASGENSLAVGTASAASGPGAVAIGANAIASGPGSVAIGAGSVASGANTISVGSAGNERTISNVAAGSRDTDAVNVSQLRASQGSGPRYDVNDDGSINPNSLTLNPGGTPVSLHNIAAGVAPNDAVNVGQLQQAVGEVRGDMWEAQREARGGNASAMAMAGMPQAYVPGANMLAVGVGGFQGEVGMAVGLSGVTDSGRYVYKAQVSGNTTSDFGFSVGAGLQW
ncbi:MAG TPA: YadA-like family protein [Stenotrophomonas sp.]|nr:YadA-like family protein [Stenotrophomonas sp.]